MPNQNKEYLEFAKILAQKAGSMMMQYFNASSIQTSWKSDHTPVTEADQKINELVIDEVKKSYPSHGVLGEEVSYEPNRKYLWITDPIDGTVPFDLGMQASTFCLALVVDDKVQVGVVLNPFTNQLFSAIKNTGCWMNDSIATIPEIHKLEGVYGFVPSGKNENRELFSDVITEFTNKNVKTLYLPSFTYMGTLLFSGKLAFAVMPYGSPWDAAAISLIVEEAGGVVTDMRGNRRSYREWGDGLLVSNKGVANEVTEIIRSNISPA